MSIEDEEYKQAKTPATLWLDKLEDFIRDACEGERDVVYITCAPAKSNNRLLAVTGEGGYVLTLSAHGEKSIIYYTEPVAGVSQLDAAIAPDDASAKIDARIAQITEQLRALEFEVRRGEWKI